MRPTISCPSRSSSPSGVSPSISVAVGAARLATSTSRFAFELVGEPITRSSVAPSADDLLDRVLPILRRVADVVRAGPLQAAEALPRTSTVDATSSSESVVCVITASGLPRRRARRRPRATRRRRSASGRSPFVPITSTWFGVADERDEMAGVGVAARLGVHLRDERADGVDDPESALLAVLAHRGRDAVGGEHADLARRDLVLVRRRTPRRAPRAGGRRCRCGRSRGGRRPAGRAVSSRRSTISIARSTPAQNERGAARSTRPPFMPLPPPRAAARAAP